MIKKIGLCIAMLGMASVVFAKNIWLVTKSDHLELCYGLDVSELYNPAKITDLHAWDVAGNPITLQKGTATQELTIVPNKEAALVTVTMDDGYWVQASSSEWKNVTLDVAHGFRVIRHPLMYHKTIYAWSKDWEKPKGLKFEIIPLDDPFKTPLGKKLTVQIFFDGKPLPNAKVQYGMHGTPSPFILADKNGKAKIPVTPVPEQFILVDYEAPTMTDGAVVVYSTTLRYELK